MGALPIRRVALAAIAVAFALLLGMQRAPSQIEGPQVSLTLPKASYLSTEGVSASLVIHNTTSAALSYTPLSVSFVIRDDDGKLNERRWITTISRPIPSTSIAPGERHRFTIALPTCDVVSDPCSEHVAVKFALTRKDVATRIALVTSEVSYSIVADPTATFRVTGLRGDLPLFFAQYEADGSVLQRVLTVRFQFDAAPKAYQTMPPEGVRAKQIVGLRGVGVVGFGFTTNSAGFEVSLSLSDRNSDKAVEGAIEDVQRAFGAQVKLVSELYAPDDFDMLPFVDQALEGARAAAQRMSDYSGGGSLSLADGSGLDGAELVKFAHDRTHFQSDFRPFRDYEFDGSLRDSAASATKGLLNIRLQATFAFVGSTVAPLSSTSPAVTETLAYVGGATRLLRLPARAILAADRPEIYAVGVTTRQAADRLGLQASAVATVLAAARVRALAEQLGVTAASATLIAAYPDVDYSPDEVIVAAGVASAPTGDFDRAWRALLPTTGTSPTVTSPFGPVFVSIATPRPRSPEPSPTTYLVPISVPGDDTLLEVRGDKPSSAAERVSTSAGNGCQALVLSAQKLSLEEALTIAVRRSAMAAKQLRHLLLAIAEPLNVDSDNACVAAASKVSLVHAPVDLIFRTR